MAFMHAALEEAEVGAAAWKVCGPEAPGPLRQMAAKGLAPLQPRDLLVTLYQFWAAAEEGLGDDAAKTLLGLPPAVIAGALDDPKLPPGVIDFMSRKFATNVEVVERLVGHVNVHDETLAGVARTCVESVCDLVAQNETRWLRAPAIVEALYQNPNCRMSVAQRVIELAVREGLEIKLPNIDEIKRVLGDAVPVDEEADEEFKGAVSKDIRDAHTRMVERIAQADAQDELIYDSSRDELTAEDLDLGEMLAGTASDEMMLPYAGVGDARNTKEQKPTASQDAVRTDASTRVSRLDVLKKIRLAVIGTAFERSVLIRDANKAVCMSAIKSPKVHLGEVTAYSSRANLSHEVIGHIAKQKHWTKNYAVKFNLVLNPKTPMSKAMAFLGFLRKHDVRKAAHSRNISSALAKAAKRKLEQRR